MKKHSTLLYHVHTYDTKKVSSRFEPGPPSPLFIATPLLRKLQHLPPILNSKEMDS